jgi:L-iditol 2-dehydrogenase
MLKLHRKRFAKEIMKALIYHAHDNIRLEEQPIPTITEQELLVKIHGCGLCGSDIIKIVQQAAPPVVLGHELTGTVVARGKAVTQFAEGQRVIVAHHVPCFECHYCRHHNYSMCTAFKASNIDPCGFAEYIRVSAAHVQHTTLPLPDTVSNEAGSFVEPLACCVRAVRRTPLLAGDSVIIMGLGAMGLLMLQAAKALGERAGQPVRVYGVDLLPERLALARELGADNVFTAPSNEHDLYDLLAPYTEGRGADAAIITAAGAHPLQQAIASIRKGGTVNIFAAHSGTVPINIEQLYHQEMSLTTTYSSSPEDLRLALDLITTHEVQVNQLITHRLKLEQFAEGVTLMRNHMAMKVYFEI